MMTVAAAQYCDLLLNLGNIIVSTLQVNLDMSYTVPDTGTQNGPPL